jgi:predicted heme/steroid binding protein
MSEERLFTEQELRRFDGEDGPAYVAFQGVVYDVSGCPRWRRGMHEQLHFPGLDLTSAMPAAPHGEEVFTRPCVKRAGLLKST